MLSSRRRDVEGARALPSAPITALATGIALAIVGGAGPARATCEEATLSVGVAVRRCDDMGLRWSVLTADLTAADVGVRVSRSSERGLSVSEWMASVPGAIAAVQGGPFEFPAWDPSGLTIGEGEAWPGAADDGELAVLALDPSGAGLLAPPDALVPAQDWMHSAVSGHVVLRAGAPISVCEGIGCERGPRTAVGLSLDRRTLVLVVVEGWTALSEGVSDTRLGTLALEAGAYDAMRIGAGATSLLATADGRGAIASSDGAPRPTAAFLGIVDRGSGTTGRMRGVIKRRSDMLSLTGAQIRVEATDGRTITMGGTLTADAYFEFVVPERTYIVRATHAGYHDGCVVCTVPRASDVWCSIYLDPGSGAAECNPPPRGVDAGEFPSADAGPRDAGGGPDGGVPIDIDGGCAVMGAPGATSDRALGRDVRGVSAAIVIAALAALARRRRR